MFFPSGDIPNVYDGSHKFIPLQKFHRLLIFLSLNLLMIQCYD